MFKNYSEIATSNLRKDALQIIKEALELSDPKFLMRRSVRYDPEFNSVIVNNQSYDMLTGRIFVVGGGKASGLMAEAIEEIIGEDNIVDGVVNTQGNYNTKKIKIFNVGHPLPDENGVKGVEEMLDLKKKYRINKKDLVICLISGGGSAMLIRPVSGVKLSEYQSANDIFAKCGANINEINIIRKHISRVKGGLLAMHFEPAKVVSVIISDVIGNDLGTIASGPTAVDESTYLDALNVIQKYNLKEVLPVSILNHLEKGRDGKLPETAKSLLEVKNYVIGDNGQALEAMSFRAKELGYRPIIINSRITGESEEAAKEIAKEIAEEINANEFNALIFGGETNPKVGRKQGQGGRNMHLSLLASIMFKELGVDWVFSSLCSDGVDHIKEAAGAIIDNNTYDAAIKRSIIPEDYAINFDSYGFFSKIGSSLVNTGYTGTNVGDVMIFLFGRNRHEKLDAIVDLHSKKIS